jgi:hypothetical protein
MSYHFRKSERRKLKVRALLQHLNGAELAVVTSVDFSASGAKLSLPSATSMPKQFLLTLSNNSAVQRKCELAWKDGTTIGVRFIKA